MALYAFDGTGNEDRENDSNVLKFFHGFEGGPKNDNPEIPTGSLYLAGVGTGTHTEAEKVLGLAFGHGGHDRIALALQRLANNIEAGDDTVDVVGFSRGAALALGFANEIARRRPGQKVRFIGLWDVVAQFGLPGRLVNAGIDIDAPPNASHIYHAMALDESRALFPLSRVTRRHAPDVRIIEAWFRGVHSDVGGGNGNTGLNWIALHWMYCNARRHGLAIGDGAIAENQALRVEHPAISVHKVDALVVRSIREGDFVHESVDLGAAAPGRELNNPKVPIGRITDDGNLFL
ncbi:MAG: DUF2235 domain-containing protein [Vicinamibacterales bacterium]